jgi:hypothetical protein
MQLNVAPNDCSYFRTEANEAPAPTYSFVDFCSDDVTKLFLERVFALQSTADFGSKAYQRDCREMLTSVGEALLLSVF